MIRIFTLFSILFASPAWACGIELTLAMDVSRSVSTNEYNLQMGGLADALDDEEVRDAIRAVPEGVLSTVFIWGDESQQKQTTDWTLLKGGAETAAFAMEVRSTRRYFGFTLTGLGAAMLYANELTKTAPRPCRRRVIDISGDGVWNNGISPAQAWSVLPRDVTVNGLVIIGATPDPLKFYKEQVIGGPAAFVEVAKDFEDYARAIKRKLLRELAPIFADARP
jgi:Ca-activated chloride channel family protein